MDVHQTARMIEWLDEERRRDKAGLALLEERLAQQQDALDALQTRLNGIESAQSTLRNGQMGAGTGAVLESLRAELLQRLEAGEARRKNAEAETGRRAELLREQLERPLRELGDKVTALQRKQTELPAVQTESDRVSGNMYELGRRIDDLSRRLEAPEQRLARLEEQRRQDSRISAASAAELPELQKQIDAGQSKLELLENLVLRSETQIRGLEASELERRERIQAFVDAQVLQTKQHEQQIDTYTARFAQYDEAMERFTGRFETWAEAFREMGTMVESLERAHDRLEQRFNELVEVQRISEERLRQDQERLNNEEQRRRKQFTLANDEVWRSHDREFERFVLAIDELRERFPPIEDALERLWNLERARVRLYHSRDLSLLQEFDQAPDSVPLRTGDAQSRAGNGRNREDN